MFEFFQFYFLIIFCIHFCHVCVLKYFYLDLNCYYFSNFVKLVSLKVWVS